MNHKYWWAVVAILPRVVGSFAVGGEPGPAMEVRLVKPERQLAEVLKLFEGTKAASPAEALSLWKRADKSRTLGKPLEALIALLNPEMMEEIKNLDDAAIGFDLIGENLDWWATIPHDDGSIAAAGPALALTDGGPEPPIDGASVHRLGPPGGPLMAQRGSLLALAIDRVRLEKALQTRATEPTSIDSGWMIKVNPATIRPGQDAPASVKLGVDVLKASDVTSVVAVMALRDGTLGIDVKTAIKSPVIATRPVIDLAWLDFVPRQQVAGVFALALDPTPEGRERLFAGVDKVERSLPDRANVAPARVRLNLLAATRGANLEVDLWPGLMGLSGFVTTNADGPINEGLVALHFRNEAAAKAGEQLAIRLAKGVKIALKRTGSSVWLASSVALLDQAWSCMDDPTLRLPMKLGPDPLERFVAAWPSRWPGIVNEPLFATMDLGPIIWTGNADVTGLHDRLRWDGGHPFVKHVLLRYLGE